MKYNVGFVLLKIVFLMLTFSGCGKLIITGVPSKTVTPEEITKEWKHLLKLHNYSAEEVYYDNHVQAINDNGEIIVAWVQTDNVNNSHLFIAEKNSTGQWDIPTNFNDLKLTLNSPQYFSLSLNNNGEAVLAWVSVSPFGSSYLYTAERDSMGEWTIPEVNDYLLTYDWGSNIEVAINDLGEIIIVWDDQGKVYKAEKNQAGVWSKPLDINDFMSIAATSASNPKVVLNNNGIAFITWHQSNGTHSQVYLAERDAVGSWTRPADHTSDYFSFAGSDSYESQLALNNNNQVILSWTQYDGVFSRLLKAERDEFGIWNKPADINDTISFPGTAVSGFSVGINILGEAFVSWIQNDGANLQLYVSTRDDLGIWSHPADPTHSISPGGQNVGYASGMINNSGEILIVWSQYDLIIGSRLFKAFRDNLDVWDMPVDNNDFLQLATGTHSIMGAQLIFNNLGESFLSYSILRSKDFYGGYPLNWIEGNKNQFDLSNSQTSRLLKGYISLDPIITQNDSGQALVMWSDRYLGENVLYKAERNTNGEWIYPTHRSQYFTSLSGSDYVFDGALNNKGEGVIVWIKEYLGEEKVYVAQRNESGIWSMPLDTDYHSLDGSGARYVRATINDFGEAIVVWAQYGGLQNNLYKSERSKTGIWTSPTDLNDYFSIPFMTFNGLPPKLMINNNGIVIVIWDQYDGNETRLFLAERDSHGIWTFPQDFDDSLSLHGQSITFLSGNLSLNNKNEALISWEQTPDGQEFHGYVAYRDKLGVWTIPSDLNDYFDFGGAKFFISPVLHLNDNSEGVMSWSEFDGMDTKIYFARFENGLWDFPSDSSDWIFNHPNSATMSLKIESTLQNDYFWLGLTASLVSIGTNQRFIWAHKKSDQDWGDLIYPQFDVNQERPLPIVNFQWSSRYMDNQGDIIVPYSTLNFGMTVSEFK